jgi:hypothetical protein
MAPNQAGLGVLVRLLLLVLGQDLVRILAAVIRSVGICDANVEDSRHSAPPEFVDANVATEFWKVALRLELLPPRCCPNLSRLKVRRRRLREMAPLRCHVVMADQQHEASLLAGHRDDLARSDDHSHRIGQGGQTERVQVAAEGCLGTRPLRALWH